MTDDTPAPRDDSPHLVSRAVTDSDEAKLIAAGYVLMPDSPDGTKVYVREDETTGEVSFCSFFENRGAWTFPAFD